MATFWPATGQTRIRFGTLSLVLGVLLIAWAWGSWMYRQSVEADVPNSIQAVEPAAQADQAAPAMALARLLLISFVLILAILLGSYGLSRSIRRYQARFRHERAPATDTTDVWAGHRLPEDNPVTATDDDEH